MYIASSGSFLPQYVLVLVLVLDVVDWARLAGPREGFVIRLPALAPVVLRLPDGRDIDI
jgi:hypothetical protein